SQSSLTAGARLVLDYLFPSLCTTSTHQNCSQNCYDDDYNKTSSTDQD
ncbi:unnamed protein product, partial [Mycena citricolor]